MAVIAATAAAGAAAATAGEHGVTPLGVTVRWVERGVERLPVRSEVTVWGRGGTEGCDGHREDSWHPSGMSSPSLPGVIVVAAIAGGVIGGAVAWGVAGSRSGGGKAKASASASPEDTEDRVAALERRMAQVERRSAFRPATPAGGTPAAPNPLPPTAAQGTPGKDEPQGVDDPVFEAAVRDVVQRVEEERENERQVQREEQRQAAAQRWANELTEKLGLRDDQKAKLLTLAREFYDSMRDVFRSDAGAGLAFEDRREKMRALRKQYDEKVGGVLDPAQLGEYQKLDDDLKLGARIRRAPPADR